MTEKIKVVLTFLVLTTALFGQWSGYGKYHNWLTKESLLIPKTGLALLVNPGAQMIEYAHGNKKYPALLYGANVYSEPTQAMTNGSLYLLEFTSNITDGKVTLSNTSISDSVSISAGDNAFYVKANATSGIWAWSTAATITNKSFKEITNVNGLTSATITDYSGNGNNGTAQGGLELAQPVHPYAWQGDGIDDYINFGNVCNVGTNDFILFDWIKLDPNTNNAFVRKGGGYNTSNPGYSLYYTLNGYINLQIGSTNKVIHNGFISNGNPLADLKWHFVAVVIDRDGFVYCYFDGELNNTIDISADKNESLDNSVDLTYLGPLSFYISQRKAGIGGIYLFDGQNGRPAVLPASYETTIIKKIYNNTKRYYQ